MDELAEIRHEPVASRASNHELQRQVEFLSATVEDAVPLPDAPVSRRLMLAGAVAVRGVVTGAAISKRPAYANVTAPLQAGEINATIAQTTLLYGSPTGHTQVKRRCQRGVDELRGQRTRRCDRHPHARGTAARILRRSRGPWDTDERLVQWSVRAGLRQQHLLLRRDRYAGYVSVPGRADNRWISINRATSGSILSNSVTTARGAGATIRIVCGGGGNTHVLVDIGGNYR